jgi:DNA-binding transcriptional regulator YiaG
MDADVFAGLRHRLGVSQDRLAQILEVHPVTVNKWERGKRPITKVVELAMWGLILIDENKRRHTGAGGGR